MGTNAMDKYEESRKAANTCWDIAVLIGEAIDLRQKVADAIKTTADGRPDGVSTAEIDGLEHFRIDRAEAWIAAFDAKAKVLSALKCRADELFTAAIEIRLRFLSLGEIGPRETSRQRDFHKEVRSAFWRNEFELRNAAGEVRNALGRMVNLPKPSDGERIESEDRDTQ